MTHLVPIRLDDNTEIFMEVTDNVDAPTEAQAPIGGRRAKGIGDMATNQMAQSFQAIEGAIRSYTTQTMKAFSNMAEANVKSVTLEFGLTVGGEAGVPYVTKGTAESNLKITVECSFD